MYKKILIIIMTFFINASALSYLGCQPLLENLAKKQNYISKRISSFDRSGGNRDAVLIKPGETAVLAEIKGPAAIHHIWVTINAEPFYGRKIILRMYWDEENFPSVETPIGDFFGVGHGLNRNLSSFPLVCSSEGRARNCYWYMPFKHSARITATNEGARDVGSFYYYIDYRVLKEIPSETPYFHACYRQETPCLEGKNYLILDALGKGHYAGCNLSILQRSMGWWGEGDDMIYVDGEEFPSLHGTGSEDYFSDAWGMREDENLFYGCPLQEPDFKTGSKATVYRFHIPDPIPFQESIRVTIEHGHANDRSDYFSSVAYWYQTEPHKPYAPLSNVSDRLPFALESTGGLIIPNWKQIESRERDVFKDENTGMIVRSDKLSYFDSSFYNQQGQRYPVLITEDATPGKKLEITLNIDIGEYYDLDIHLLRGPSMGNLQASELIHRKNVFPIADSLFEGYHPEVSIDILKMQNVRLYKGKNTLVLKITGSSSQSQGMEAGFVSLGMIPANRLFITEWNLISPFDAPDMTYLQTSYPPENEIDLSKQYSGKNGVSVGWEKIQADQTGYIRLENRINPPENGIVYGFVNVYSPEDLNTVLLVGSDDGIRIWLNDNLVHTNPAYRGAYPDQDQIPVTLNKGWNKLLIKVLQGSGGWGYYVRFVDPENILRWSTRLE